MNNLPLESSSTFINPNIIHQELSEELDRLASSNGHSNSGNISLVEKFKKTLLDQNKDYPSPIAAINLILEGENFPILTLKSLSLWQGKQKSKKTTALGIAVAAFISAEKKSDGIKFEADLKGKVLYFDTEQGESYGARTMKLILKIAGLSTCPNLLYSDLREYTPGERIEIIKAGIESTSDLIIVVIDGLVDLMKDFMSPDDGHRIITDLLKLASQHNIHIACVLHQNKADKNARAHIGSIASQKCEIEISAQVHPQDKAKSIVSCVNSRGLPFPEFEIEWQKGSLPGICQVRDGRTQRQILEEEYLKEAKKAVEEIFKDDVPLIKARLVEKLAKELKLSPETIKRSRIRLLMDNGILEKVDGKYYKLVKILPSGMQLVHASNLEIE
jgi:hypothetical protein